MFNLKVLNKIKIKIFSYRIAPLKEIMYLHSKQYSIQVKHAMFSLWQQNNIIRNCSQWVLLSVSTKNESFRSELVYY